MACEAKRNLAHKKNILSIGRHERDQATIGGAARPRLKISQLDKKMKLTKHTRSVSVLSVFGCALAMTAFAGNPAGAANEPVYNPATEVSVRGTITGIRQVAAGAPLAGVHMTVQSKTGAVDVYLGPSDFLKFLKAGFKTGEQIEVIGSKVKSDDADVILTRQ